MKHRDTDFCFKNKSLEDCYFEFGPGKNLGLMQVKFEGGKKKKHDMICVLWLKVLLLDLDDEFPY